MIRFDTVDQAQHVSRGDEKKAHWVSLAIKCLGILASAKSDVVTGLLTYFVLSRR